MIIKGLRHGVKVRCGSEDDKDVKDLMRTAPNVELAREASFGPSGSVQDCTKDVHGAMKNDQTDAHSILESLVSVTSDALQNRYDAGQAQSDKHGSAIDSPFWFAEAVYP